jgi:hypothetical protein
MHKAICWSKSDPFLEWKEYLDWQAIGSKGIDSVAGILHMSSSKAPSTPKKLPPDSSEFVFKCKSYIIPANKRPKVKKIKFIQSSVDPSEAVHLSVPLRTTWMNNSCAYDTVFVVLFNIWCENPAQTSASWWCLQSELLDSLMTSFETHENFQVDRSTSRHFSLEQIRNFMRCCLARISAEFTFGSYASVHSIAHSLLKMCHPITVSELACPNKHDVGRNID